MTQIHFFSTEQSTNEMFLSKNRWWSFSFWTWTPFSTTTSEIVLIIFSRFCTFDVNYPWEGSFMFKQKCQVCRSKWLELFHKNCRKRESLFAKVVKFILIISNKTFRDSQKKRFHFRRNIVRIALMKCWKAAKKFPGRICKKPTLEK